MTAPNGPPTAKPAIAPMILPHILCQLTFCAVPFYHAGMNNRKTEPQNSSRVAVIPQSSKEASCTAKPAVLLSLRLTR